MEVKVNMPKGTLSKFSTALIYAAERHAGQVYPRCSEEWPYITHCIRVAMKFCSNENLMAIALLHDVVEDTDATIDDIREILGGNIAIIVGILTRSRSESYDNYITRVMENKTAMLVKLADLEDNLKHCLADDAPAWTSSLIPRYARAIKRIKDKLNE